MCSWPRVCRELCLPNPSWHGQDLMLSSAGFLGDDPGAREKGLADPHGSGCFLSTEEALGSVAFGSRNSWKTCAQRELGWLRAFLRCVKVWASVGLNLSQKCLWIQVCIPSGSCLQLGKKNFLWYHTLPACSAFPKKAWVQFSDWVLLYNPCSTKKNLWTWTFWFPTKYSNCGNFCWTRCVGQDRTVTSWKGCAIVFAPGFGSMDRCEYPEISEISKAHFIKTKLCDPFTPEQNFWGLSVLLSAQLFSRVVLNKAA